MLYFRSSRSHATVYKMIASAVLALSVLATAPVAAASLSDRTKRPASPLGLPQATLTVDVVKTNDRVLVSGERGRVLMSDDMGETWIQADVPVSVMITAMSAVTNGIVWAVGHDGVVLRSEDTGATWTKMLDGEALNQLIVGYYQKQVALAEADSSIPPEALEELMFRADDAVLAQEDKLFPTLLDVFFVNPEEGYVLGSYGLLMRTIDGGLTWQLLTESLGNQEGYHLNAMTKVDDALVVVGEGGFLSMSQDQGESWVRLQSPYQGSFFGVEALGGRRMVAYGLRGNAFESSDAGESWHQLKLPVRNTLAGSSTLEDGSLVMVGNFGALLVRTKNQETISSIALPKPVPALSVTQLDKQRVLVATVIGPQIVDLEAALTRIGE